MTISSMTGFARQNGEKAFETKSFSWFWEIKSVNGKALDIKAKLPPAFDGLLGMPLKNIAARYFVRGSFSVYLDLEAVGSSTEAKIDDALLQKLTIKAIELYESFPDKLQKPSVGELLSLRGVYEADATELNEAENQALAGALLESFEEGCRRLQQDRQAEGKKMKAALLDILDKIANIVAKVEGIAESQPERLKEKLLAQIASLLEPSNQISEERLAQEVALYVAKADIREEIDRLKAHLATAQNLLNSGEAVGRRLDFLCQELNREANTTCSKSSEIDLTNLGMSLKTLIEQFREQVQNIE